MHHSRDRERWRAASTVPGCVARRRHRHTHPQSTASAGLLRQLRLDGGSSVSNTNVTPLLLHVTSRDGEKRSKTHEQQARTRMKKCLYAGEMRTTACITAQKRCFIFLSSRLPGIFPVVFPGFPVTSTSTNEFAKPLHYSFVLQAFPKWTKFEDKVAHSRSRCILHLNRLFTQQLKQGIGDSPIY